ncbi:MAG: penicillin acylase family protein, partial [Kordiimonadaceae bacterium]|nr:penicillin acylase family protein [Kordiimonadaceae bacterium]
WYKLRLKLNDGSLDITGVSLTGAPIVIVGSNGSVAWGFTNTNIDTSDIIELTINPQNENQYLTKDGYMDFETISETINVSGGGSPEMLIIKETIWGPVIDKNTDKKYAYRWVAHMPDGVNMSLIGMEKVRSVKDAMSIANQMGIPAQNAMLVDKDGNAGWTIFGRIPRRPEGDFGAIKNWSTGEYDWNEWYSSAEYPKVYNPENGRLWTANTRVASNADLARVGTSSYALGARAKQIRDRLMALQAPLVEEDLYKIMLDDEAIFLSRWQKQLEGVLLKADDASFQPYLEQVVNWGGAADKNSIGFRLVRNYRIQVYETLFAHISGTCVSYDKNCNYDRATNQWEAPLWQLVSEMPADWLPGGYDNWQFFYEKAAFDAWKPVITGEINLQDYTWGNRNTTEIKHPLSAAVPFLGKLTDMPAVQQSGDTANMPHISGRVQGQSERIVVSPGHEEDGIMNLPAGQSGHPLSPYYGAGHDDWLNGNMTPFLPQETKWKLEFSPG